MTLRKAVLAIAVCSAATIAATPTLAAPMITAISADLSRSPYTFDYLGSAFTFGFNGDYFGAGPVTVSTATGGEINTIFGQPTTNFADGRGGPVTFGPSMQYATFASPTPIRFSNGGNLIGLRAVTAAGTYYGYAFSTNNLLNSIGFESVAGAAVAATTAIPSAVPEPASWAMMIMGFGVVGAAMRKRSRVRTSVTFA